MCKRPYSVLQWTWFNEFFVNFMKSTRIIIKPDFIEFTKRFIKVIQERLKLFIGYTVRILFIPFVPYARMPYTIFVREYRPINSLVLTFINESLNRSRSVQFIRSNFNFGILEDWVFLAEQCVMWIFLGDMIS